MCSREDRVGSGLIRRMDAPPPSHGRRLGQGATPKCPFPPYLAGASPSVPPQRSLMAFSAFYVRFQAVFPAAPPLCSSFNGSASGTATPPPSSPPPHPPPPLYHLAHGGGGAHIFRHINHILH